jgi:hypothetical protein
VETESVCVYDCKSSPCQYRIAPDIRMMMLWTLDFGVVTSWMRSLLLAGEGPHYLVVLKGGSSVHSGMDFGRSRTGASAALDPPVMDHSS